VGKLPDNDELLFFFERHETVIYNQLPECSNDGLRNHFSLNN
jgi:hypothetical protein